MSGCYQRYQEFKKDFNDRATNRITDSFANSVFASLTDEEKNMTVFDGRVEAEFWEELYLIYNNPRKWPALKAFIAEDNIFSMCLIPGLGCVCMDKR